ncbi:MAG: ATP-dependent zinc protease [Aliiglaciecola sp.]
MIFTRFNTNMRHFALLFAAANIVACQTTGTATQQQTLDTITQSEQRIIERLAQLDARGEQNDGNIQSLRDELSALKQQVAKSQVMLADYLSKKENNAPTQAESANQTVVNNNGDFVLGALEHITIEAVNLSFDARIDTGAATSSINAVDIEVFERNGDDWVRFHVLDDSKKATDENWIEAPVVRFVNIRQASSEEPERRAVVKLWTRLGEMRDNSEFTLADRSHMTHPVLLGREFIRDVAVVDVSKEFVQSDPK